MTHWCGLMLNQLTFLAVVAPLFSMLFTFGISSVWHNIFSVKYVVVAFSAVTVVNRSLKLPESRLLSFFRPLSWPLLSFSCDMCCFWSCHCGKKAGFARVTTCQNEHLQGPKGRRRCRRISMHSSARVCWRPHYSFGLLFQAFWMRRMLLSTWTSHVKTTVVQTAEGLGWAIHHLSLAIIGQRRDLTKLFFSNMLITCRILRGPPVSFQF